MQNGVERVLISKEDVQKRVKELAAEINKEYAGKKLTLVCILTGAIVFAVDLMRELTMEVEVDFMKASSYGSSTCSSGGVQIFQDLKTNINGKHVLVVDDIYDTGFTLSRVKTILEDRNPASLKIAACLSKPERRIVDMKIDYIGFEIPDVFIIGYGLDYSGKYRNLPDVCVLAESEYK